MYKRVDNKTYYEGGNSDTPDPLLNNSTGPSTKINAALSSVQSEQFESIGLGQGLWMIFKQSLFPIIGMLFHPMYLLVNVQILGNMKVNETKCGKGAT